jgi:hypothetical protein
MVMALRSRMLVVLQVITARVMRQQQDDGVAPQHDGLSRDDHHDGHAPTARIWQGGDLHIT